MKFIERGGMWQVHYDDAHGDRQRASTRVKVDPNQPDRGRNSAQLAALDIVRAGLLDVASPAERAKAGRRKTLGMALTTAFETIWRHQKSKREKQYQVNQLVRTVGYKPLPEVTYEWLQDIGREWEEAGDAPATRNRKMSTIHTAMTEAHKKDGTMILPAFPHWSEDNVKERYVDDTEEAKLLAYLAGNAAPADAEACYLRDLVPFLIDTGLRASEALTLTPMQDRKTAVWLKHGSTKSGKGRTVPLTARARIALTGMLASPMQPELHKWYAQNKNKPATWAGSRFRAACAKIDPPIEGATLHTLRHTCASRLVQAGVSLYVVKEWLGHSSITITERYAHLAPASFDGALAALEGRATDSATVSQGELVPSRFDTVSGDKGRGIKDLRGAKEETRSHGRDVESST